MKDLKSSDYSCQFVGDTMSILVETDDTTNADIELIRQFDRQMSQLNLGDLASEDLFQILASLPTYEHCNHLYERFEACVHPVVPICHLPSLKRTLTGFWGEYTVTGSGDALSLLLSVVYAGLTSSSEERDIRVATSVYRSYEILLHKLDFPHDVTKSTVSLLQSYLIVNTCRASQIDFLRSFGFLPLAVRVAQSLKLHTESKASGGVDAEVRRRIWWHLLYLDTEAALVSGLPILIHEDDYTTQMPCRLNDDSIVDRFGMVTRQFQAHSPMMISMRGRWHWVLRMRAWRRQKPTSGELSEFEQQITHLSAELDSTEADPWAAAYLRLQYDRGIVSVAQGFMNGKSITGVDCDHEVLSSHVCALQNPTEPSDHHRPDMEEGQRREQKFLSTDEENVQRLSNAWDANSGEPSDTIDMHEYEDVFEQYLHPGVMG
ncbi:MAG: hypothetical protein Q9191_002946 [Dirinaria sp. TL-2023a]